MENINHFKLISFLGITVLILLAGCQKKENDKGNAKKYSCNSQKCIEDPNGLYNSLSECESICAQTADRYDCLDGTCEITADGAYSSLSECQSVCGMPVNVSSITLSVPTFSLITNNSISHRLYFTDTNSLARYYVIKDRNQIIKDTFSSSYAIGRSISFGEIFKSTGNIFGTEARVSVEGYSKERVLVSKTTVDHVYTAVPTKVKIQIDSKNYLWENFGGDNNHRPDVESFFVNIPDLIPFSTWETVCKPFDTNEHKKSFIYLMGHTGIGDEYNSTSVKSENPCGSVTLSGPSGGFVNGDYYTLFFAGTIGIKSVTGDTSKLHVSGEITQGVPTDGQLVDKHIYYE